MNVSVSDRIATGRSRVMRGGLGASMSRLRKLVMEAAARAEQDRLEVARSQKGERERMRNKHWCYW